ncbi:DUF504 domain-containing protein [Candidatus Woesearchaeota archaeon]|nr:DUF504 domain-containing protein [Candidatus Woesearchaeota archaeon]
MQPIRDLLSKIMWDPNENPELYSVFYMDRVKNRLIEVTFEDIISISENFMLIARDDEQVDIPLHRVKEVRKEEKLIWQRPKSEADG